MPYPPCEHAWRATGYLNQKPIETYYLADQYIFVNEIPDIESETRTNPGWILHDDGYCKWIDEPPHRFAPDHREIDSPSTTEQPPQPEPTKALVSSSSDADPTVAQGVASMFFMVAMIGGCVWLYLRGKGQSRANSDYHPMADLPRLPRLSELRGEVSAALAPDSNQTHGIRGEFDPEFDLNSAEFDSNSTSNSTPSAADSTWPPTDRYGPYDPLQPEQEFEFDDYRKQLEKHGLSPKGNEIIYLLWGAKPGNSSKYKAAVTRRDQFARRLDYYRYEGA